MTTTRASTPTVQDVMTHDPVCVAPSDTIAEVARLFDNYEISGAPVVDGQHVLLGVVSKTDILHRALEGPVGSPPGAFFTLLAEGGFDDADAGSLGTVEEFMTSESITARPDESAAVAAARMADERVHRIIVVDAGHHPVGVVTALDLLSVFPRQ